MSGQIIGPIGVLPTVAADAAQTTAFLARADAITTVGATERAAYKVFINGGVADGWWAKMDALYLFATDTAAHALLSLVSATFNATAVGGPTFTADIGYLGDGATQYVASNFNPTTAVSPLYQQNDAHFSFWNLSNLTATGKPSMGGDDTNIALYPNFSGADCYTRVNDGGGSVTIGNPQGHLLGTRSGSSSRTTYQNGSSLGSVSVASAAITNTSILILGDGGGLSTYQCAAASIGGGLNGTDVTNFYSRLRAYMTAVGVP